MKATVQAEIKRNDYFTFEDMRKLGYFETRENEDSDVDWLETDKTAELNYDKDRDGLKREFMMYADSNFANDAFAVCFKVEVLDSDCDELEYYQLTEAEIKEAVYNALYGLKKRHGGYWADYYNSLYNKAENITIYNMPKEF